MNSWGTTSFSKRTLFRGVIYGRKPSWRDFRHQFCLKRLSKTKTKACFKKAGLCTFSRHGDMPNKRHHATAIVIFTPRQRQDIRPNLCTIFTTNCIPFCPWSNIFTFLFVKSRVYNIIKFITLLQSFLRDCKWLLKQHTNKFTYIVFNNLKFTLKHLKRSYMFRSYDHPQGAYFVSC